MKQIAQKKRKVLRTLVRIIHIGDKSHKLVRCDSDFQMQGKRMKSSQASISSFPVSKFKIRDKEG